MQVPQATRVPSERAVTQGIRRSGSKLRGTMGQRIVHFHVGRSAHAFFREQVQAVPDGFVYRTPHRELEAGGAATRRLAAHGQRLGRLRARAEWASIRSLSYAGFVRRARVT